MNYIYIDNDKELELWLHSLEVKEIDRLSVDIEGEFNLHCYGEHLCLVQVFDGNQYVLIDPQQVRVSLIKKFFENPRYAKIMYDCTGDRTLLYRKYGINITNIEDLFPAAELMDLPKRNLSYVQNHFLSVEEKAKKKFQQYNWMKRPITADALEYALEDVKYLFDLQKALLSELEELSLLEEYNSRNAEVQKRAISLKSVPGVLRKNRFKKMPPQSQDLFKSLFYIREEYAERLNLPPNTVISNEDLFQVVMNEKQVSHLKVPYKMPPSMKQEMINRFLEDCN